MKRRVRMREWLMSMIQFCKGSFRGGLVLICFLMSTLGVLAQDAFRSTGSGGDWGSTSTWEVATTYNPYTWTSASSTPGASDTVYLEAGTTVSLSGDESVADLHFNNTVDVERFNTGNNTIDIYGKIRIYNGAAPGTSLSGSAGVQGWINTGASGKLRFVGSSNRTVVRKGQFGARMENAGMTVEFAFDPADTAFIDETVRFGNVTVSSGVLYVLKDHTIRPTETDTRTDAADGNLTIAAGATMYGGRGIFKNKSNAINSITVEAGGKLIFNYPDPVLAANTIDISGALELLYDQTTEANTYQHFPDASTRFGASTVNTAARLVLGGNSQKLLYNDFTVSDTLVVSETYLDTNNNYPIIIR